ncbi:MAG: enoyl-CoA hydratase [Dehalococcoidia bacterium]|nr:MAG: enoyl-CoA hydratase [Dehalococcoidia bacterium]
MADYATIRLEQSGGVASVTLARPDAANAFDETMARELAEVAEQCDGDRSVRVVLITGVGTMFSAGGDLRSFAQQGEALPEHLRTVTRHAHAAFSRFARMRAPVIAAVNGAAAGIGMSLVAACDLAIAADTARFTLAYTRVGLTPDGGSTYTLPRIVGLKRALELVLSNPALTASQALEWGLVNRVVPADELAQAARAWAEELARGPAGALGTAKRLMRLGAGDGFEAQMELESQAIAEAGATADAREGIAAFLGRRAPAFPGN